MGFKKASNKAAAHLVHVDGLRAMVGNNAKSLRVFTRVEAQERGLPIMERAKDRRAGYLPPDLVGIYVSQLVNSEFSNTLSWRIILAVPTLGSSADIRRARSKCLNS